MQELVGRLTALDPEASETLKVIAYFDTLVRAGAGLDALLRGAAALSGTVAGAERHDRISRRAPDGTVPEGESGARAPERTYAAGAVWLERDGALHANDEMVVERLALAADLIEARRRNVGELEIAIDATRSLAERRTALARLRVEPTSQIRILATPPDARAPAGPSAILPTGFGLARATLLRAEPPGLPDSGGLGQRVSADHAPDSWEGAIVALRLTDPADPVVDAGQLGALLMLAHAHDPDTPHPDVTRLASLDPRSAEVLRALAEAESLRSAATALGMHHSSLQARHEALTELLGYDPRTTLGKVRYAAAAFLLRLTALE